MIGIDVILVFLQLWKPSTFPLGTNEKQDVGGVGRLLCVRTTDSARPVVERWPVYDHCVQRRLALQGNPLIRTLWAGLPDPELFSSRFFSSFRSSHSLSSLSFTESWFNAFFTPDEEHMARTLGRGVPLFFYQKGKNRTILVPAKGWIDFIIQRINKHYKYSPHLHILIFSLNPS